MKMDIELELLFLEPENSNYLKVYTTSGVTRGYLLVIPGIVYILGYSEQHPLGL